MNLEVGGKQNKGKQKQHKQANKKKKKSSMWVVTKEGRVPPGDLAWHFKGMGHCAD